jgi:hypothetical protein
VPYADPAKKRAYCRAYYLRNRERAICRAKEHYQRNKAQIKESRKTWRLKNRAKLTEINRSYRHRRAASGNPYKMSSSSKARHRAWCKRRFKERYKHDFAYTIVRILRYRLWQVTISEGRKRAGAALELLGCSIEQFRAHLETQFSNRMNWKNYGSAWHIDHIIPCSAFDLSDPRQQQQCFHYTNLRPLWARANIRKGNRLTDPQLSLLM